MHQPKDSALSLGNQEPEINAGLILELSNIAMYNFTHIAKRLPELVRIAHESGKTEAIDFELLSKLTHLLTVLEYAYPSLDMIFREIETQELLGYGVD